MPPSGVDASPKPSPPRPMVDFCSGASFAALNEGKIIQSRNQSKPGPGLSKFDHAPNRAVRGSFTVPFPNLDPT